ncbi:MAG: hypothetical protein HZA88_00495 [Verrucomicrobia bacterium]|nr:hypothetical protein [Verrucomicrobiota bacterium]
MNTSTQQTDDRRLTTANPSSVLRPPSSQWGRLVGCELFELKPDGSIGKKLDYRVGWRTLYRLMRSEPALVRSRKPSPQIRDVDLDSLAAHLHGCEDPEYWDTKIACAGGRMATRRQIFREAI